MVVIGILKSSFFMLKAIFDWHIFRKPVRAAVYWLPLVRRGIRKSTNSRPRLAEARHAVVKVVFRVPFWFKGPRGPVAGRNIIFMQQSEPVLSRAR